MFLRTVRYKKLSKLTADISYFERALDAYCSAGKVEEAIEQCIDELRSERIDYENLPNYKFIRRSQIKRNLKRLENKLDELTEKRGVKERRRFEKKASNGHGLEGKILLLIVVGVLLFLLPNFTGYASLDLNKPSYNLFFTVSTLSGLIVYFYLCKK